MDVEAWALGVEVGACLFHSVVHYLWRTVEYVLGRCRYRCRGGADCEWATM